ncbi:YkgJ family cysteine cluster protein [Maribellus sp. YY47]|uniref:YkgJ family cysteine cluster protein n=1 Tax=Maribellus sp. YY47 TaxID=2929486 RepID=UPI002000F47E|nr:YkgJ family cysteine cluster protein [Maribellus sp. YY47]MCK3684803.1 hypothetical protein [Maribellus sp. YY47]
MYHKIQRVRKVLNDAATHAERFGKTSGLTCAAGCNRCCVKKDIHASTLEFFPLAYHLVKNGLAEGFYQKLEQIPDNDMCALFSALGDTPGSCSNYPYRGLICRLFGYSSGPDKQGQYRLVSCKTLKETPAYNNLTPQIIGRAPVFSAYYMQLAAIDFMLANESLQINQAIKRALELVMTHYLYRRPGRRA